MDIDIILGYIEAAVKDMNDYGNPYEYSIEMLDDMVECEENKEEKNGQVMSETVQSTETEEKVSKVKNKKAG